jgi:hypothetical protein
MNTAEVKTHHIIIFRSLGRGAFRLKDPDGGIKSGVRKVSLISWGMFTFTLRDKHEDGVWSTVKFVG